MYCMQEVLRLPRLRRALFFPPSHARCKTVFPGCSYLSPARNTWPTRSPGETETALLLSSFGEPGIHVLWKNLKPT